jgi:lipopolysaccharide heptosyltransferase I
MKRILIVRLSALGDIVHALPVLAAIGRRWPEARVDWLVEEAYAPILSMVHGLHRRVIVRARASAQADGSVSFASSLRAIAYLRRQRYEAALDLQGLVKSAVWARLSGAHRVIGFNRANLREALAARFYTETLEPQKHGHVIQKNLSVLYALGAVPGPPEFPLRPEAREATLDAIRQAGGPKRYVVLNPGAAWPNKRWPPDRFGALAATLAEKAGLTSLVTWGPSERALADEVCAASKDAASPAPATELGDLAVLLRDAALVVAGDTGPLHIAAALGTPIVGLYGPTWPERNGPWAPADEVISRAGVCGCHHKRRCLRGNPCIEQIALTDVVAAAARRLRKARRA